MHTLHVGHLHLPVYGVCASLGLIGTLLLSPLTARRLRLDPDKVWDAVVAIGIAALVVSRTLLVAGSFQFFLRQPILVLSLPTVNDTGMLLTAAFAAAYLRWKRLPLLRFLDALGPCAALLWSFLSFGRLAEGTREGMPSRFGVWPVELLATIVAALLCAMLLWTIRATRPSGRVCAYGLVSAGTAIFAVDFLRLPSDLDGTGILDPVQWLGLAMIVAGAALAIAVPNTGKTGSDAV